MTTSGEAGRIIGQALAPIGALALGWYWYNNYKKKKERERNDPKKS